MARKTSLKMSCVLFASVLLAAAGISLGARSASAANYNRHARVVHRLHHAYATYRSAPYAPSARLPYGPENGFFATVPPNAIRGPGYTFVPGVGILGGVVRPADECVRQPLPRR
jgi:hypothetical protein